MEIVEMGSGCGLSGREGRVDESGKRKKMKSRNIKKSKGID